MPPAAPRRCVPGPYQRAGARIDLNTTALRARGSGCRRNAVVVQRGTETGRPPRERQVAELALGVAQAVDEDADGAGVEMAGPGLVHQLIDRPARVVGLLPTGPG